MRSIAQTLEGLLHSSAIVDWNSVSPLLHTQIARAAPDTAIECVVYPTTPAELTEVITCAHLNHWRLLVCGQASKLHWGGLAENIQLVVSTARLNQIIEHASGDLTVTAEAGLRLVDLQGILATTEQFLAVDPAYGDQATLGGIVATGNTGAFRQRYGSIRDMLIGISFVRSDGKITKAGGRVVKNVAGYDLMKLLTGSYGSLGILTQLTFRIYPLPPTSGTIVLTGAPPALAQAIATLLASALTPTALELLAPATVKALALGTEMGTMLRFQGIDVSVDQQIDQVMKLGRNLGLTVVQVSAQDESSLWKQLAEQIDAPPSNSEITCKIGVEPAQAVTVLAQIDALSSLIGMRIHASSGVGMIRLPQISVDRLLELRQLCQSYGGFLTLLAAPASFKQQVDIWGYSGNALDIMYRLKAQFDPENLLNPNRFVGKI